MASMSYVATKLAEAGLEVQVDAEDEFILVEDSGLGFDRSHRGVKGIARFLKETLDEYEAALKEALTDADQALLEIALEEEALANEAEGPPELFNEANVAKEKPTFNFVESLLKKSLGAQPAADPPAREFVPAPPIKEHAPVGRQLAIARVFNSPKEIYQAGQNDLQDRGSIPYPEDYIRDMKQEAAEMEATVASIVETVFVVSGVGYVKGPFTCNFAEAEKAKAFARRCVAAAKSKKFAATIKVVPFTTRRAV